MILNLLDATDWYSYWEYQRTGFPLLRVGGTVIHYLNAIYNLGIFHRVSLSHLGFPQPFVGATAEWIAPVLQDMAPHSTFFDGQLNGIGLNTPENLAREASATSARVGIVGNFGPPGNIMIRSMPFSEPLKDKLITARAVAYTAGVLLYEYYANYIPVDDPYFYELNSRAVLWAYLAFDMMDIDVYWLYSIGALGSYVGNGKWTYNESDGIVPDASQRYPGATSIRLIPGSIIHTREKESDSAYTQFAAALRADLNLPDRPRTVSFVTVTPGAPALLVGSTVQLTAQAFDDQHQSIPAPAATWTTSNPNIASVSQAGLVTATGAGTAVISATINTVAGTSNVQVTTPPPTPSFNSVSISGPDAVRPTATCEWRATPDAGEGHSYTWRRNGKIVGGNSPQLELPPQTSSFTLGVTVTLDGTTRETSINVTVTDQASACLVTPIG